MKNQVTVEEWVKRFKDIGLDDAAMEKWHRLFELENTFCVSPLKGRFPGG